MQEDIQLPKFFINESSCEDELEKLESACNGNSSILALARHGLICIERQVESGEVVIEDAEAEENESWLKEQQLNIGVLLSACTGVDPSVFVLALQGLCDIVESDQPYHGWPDYSIQTIKQLLKKWRCESLVGSYIGRQFKILRSLTTFKEFDVPLFVDNYGNKEVLNNYKGIDENTPIYHVTHQAEADKIFEEKRLKPSDNKNMIKGTWFGIDGPDKPSIYGSRSFKTTLGKLGVQVLRQGEIVSYKHEVNVILYAGKFDDIRVQWDGRLDARGLKMPIVTHPKYVKISIFVPAEFLPSTSHEFSEVFPERPVEVKHGGRDSFCLKEKRIWRYRCPDIYRDNSDSSRFDSDN